MSLLRLPRISRLRHAWQADAERGVILPSVLRVIVETIPAVGGLLLAFVAGNVGSGFEEWQINVFLASTAAFAVGVMYSSIRDVRGGWLVMVLAISYIALLAAMRHLGGGSTSGFAPLYLLAIWWLGLRGTRVQVMSGMAIMIAAVSLPILVFGSPEYPSSDWVRVLSIAFVSTSVGAAFVLLIGRLERANLQLLELALTDPLTSLANRRSFAHIAEREQRRSRRNDAPLYVAMIDLDHFKAYNDAHGHDGGDELLVKASEAWDADLRAGDHIARFGGEEFAVLISSASSEDEAIATVTRLQQHVPFQQTCSIGVAEWSADMAMDEVLTLADERLYAAKSGGRDRVVGSVAP